MIYSLITVGLYSLTTVGLYSLTTKKMLNVSLFCLTRHIVKQRPDLGMS